MFVLALTLLACPAPPVAPPPVSPPDTVEAAVTEDRLAARRQRMVDTQLRGRGVVDAAVLAAMARVERHRFVPAGMRAYAYEDGPLPIGEEQTISQPYIVALMSEALHAKPGMRVLEIGTGSGYQAAVLAEMGLRVWSIEIVPELGARARDALGSMGYLDRITLRVGDGYRGWPEEAPFDRIVLTAAPDHVPEPLTAQLAVGGRMVLPVGPDEDQRLLALDRVGPEEWKEETLLGVRFVPMTGEAERR